MWQLQIYDSRSLLVVIVFLLLVACGGSNDSKGDENLEAPSILKDFNAQISVSGNGHVTSLSASFDCFDSLCSASLDASMEVLALPALGYRFEEWSDPNCGFREVCSLEETTLIATFIKLPPEVPKGSWIGGIYMSIRTTHPRVVYRARHFGMRPAEMFQWLIS
jgi:hypothetical protein